MSHELAQESGMQERQWTLAPSAISYSTTTAAKVSITKMNRTCVEYTASVSYCNQNVFLLKSLIHLESLGNLVKYMTWRHRVSDTTAARHGTYMLAPPERHTIRC